MVYLDLDNFKEINDNFGHETGDKVLKLVASKIESQLNANNCVGRIGGDEFVILGLFEHKEAAQKFANNMQLKLSVYQLHINEQGPLNVVVSASFEIFETVPSNVRGMLVSADESMYRVKRLNKKKYIE